MATIFLRTAFKNSYRCWRSWWCRTPHECTFVCGRKKKKGFFFVTKAQASRWPPWTGKKKKGGMWQGLRYSTLSGFRHPYFCTSSSSIIQNRREEGAPLRNFVASFFFPHTFFFLFIFDNFVGFSAAAIRTSLLQKRERKKHTRKRKKKVL